MIPYVHVKCTVPNCNKFMNKEIADDLIKKGKPVVCWDHRTWTVDDITKAYKGLGSTSKGTSA